MCNDDKRKVDSVLACKLAELLCCRLDIVEACASTDRRRAAWLIAGNEIRRAAKQSTRRRPETPTGSDKQKPGL
jgi:hypothetical protein